MDYCRLGRTDLKVSRIGLGTMTWGEQNSEADAHAQMDLAVAEGVNFFDTAEMYPVAPRAETQGRTEAYIGTWLRKTGRRQDIVLAYGTGSYSGSRGNCCRRDLIGGCAGEVSWQAHRSRCAR